MSLESGHSSPCDDALPIMKSKASPSSRQSATESSAISTFIVSISKCFWKVLTTASEDSNPSRYCVDCDLIVSGKVSLHPLAISLRLSGMSTNSTELVHTAVAETVPMWASLQGSVCNRNLDCIAVHRRRMLEVV